MLLPRLEGVTQGYMSLAIPKHPSLLDPVVGTSLSLPMAIRHAKKNMRPIVHGSRPATGTNICAENNTTRHFCQHRARTIEPHDATTWRTMAPEKQVSTRIREESDEEEPPNTGSWIFKLET